MADTQSAQAMIPGYVANCHNQDCPECVFLPAPSPPRSFDAQPYWPTGTWPLLDACPSCSEGNVFLRSDFRDAEIPNLATDASDIAWWFLEVRCSENNCGLRLRLHTLSGKHDIPEGITQIV